MFKSVGESADLAEPSHQAGCLKDEDTADERNFDARKVRSDCIGRADDSDRPTS
jgi:hypothetical protein